MYVWDAGFPATFAVPSPKLHENVYGDVPPLAVALTLIDVPTVPVVGTVAVTVSVLAIGVTVVEAVAVFAFVSVAVTVIVNVPLTA